MAKKATKTRQRAQGGKQAEAQAVPTAAPTSPGTPPPGIALAPVSPLTPAFLAETALIRRQQKQKWTAKNLPKRQRMRQTVAATLAMKVQGYSTAEIAEKLGVKPASIRQYLFIAGREGWLDTRDPHEKAHSELVHRAVSNAEEWLHARDSRTGLPDKEFTLEAMKGFGVFGTGVGPSQAAEGNATNVLAIQITMPSGSNLPQMRSGNAGGVGAYVEGEVIGASKKLV